MLLVPAISNGVTKVTVDVAKKFGLKAKDIQEAIDYARSEVSDKHIIYTLLSNIVGFLILSC